jgi:hypothetical protein
MLDAVALDAVARGALGRMAEAVALMEPARLEYADLSETQEFVRLLAELARGHMLLGNPAKAAEVVNEALPTAEKLELLWETMELLVTRATSLAMLGRLRESIITLLGAVTVSSSRMLPSVELRARVNLSFTAAADDPPLAFAAAREGYDLACRLGYHAHGFYLLGNATDLAIAIGDWDAADAMLVEGEPAGMTDRADIPMLRAAQLRGLRGGTGTQVDGVIDWIEAELGEVSESQLGAAIAEIRGELAFARGEPEDAYQHSIAAFRRFAAPDSHALPRAARAAGWLGDLVGLREARQLADALPGRVPAAWRQEMDATIAALEGRRQESISLFLEAIHRLRVLGLGYDRAVVAVSSVKMLGSSVAELGKEIEEAEETLRRLGAAPMLERLAQARLAGPAAEQAPAEAAAATGEPRNPARVPTGGSGP